MDPSGYFDRKFPIQFVLYEQLSGMIELIRLLKKIGLAPKKTILIRGAYHYYRPNENSLNRQLFS
jgi:lysozyme